MNDINVNNYSQNPFISPLINFNSLAACTFTQLPENGKVKEIAKRIGIAIAAPFVYLALAFVALIGLTVHCMYKKNPTTKQEGSHDSTDTPPTDTVQKAHDEGQRALVKDIQDKSSAVNETAPASKPATKSEPSVNVSVVPESETAEPTDTPEPARETAEPNLSPVPASETAEPTVSPAPASETAGIIVPTEANPIAAMPATVVPTETASAVVNSTPQKPSGIKPPKVYEKVQPSATAGLQATVHTPAKKPVAHGKTPGKLNPAKKARVKQVEKEAAETFVGRLKNAKKKPNTKGQFGPGLPPPKGAKTVQGAHKKG
jgi:hypothetical protein